MSDRTLCIYHHNCADGFTGAWVVREALGEDNVEFHPGVYSKSPPDVSGRHVILVDFSYKQAVVEAMAKQAASILILDHHESAQKEIGHYPEPPAQTHNEGLIEAGMPVAAVFDMERSGCMIAWDYFFPELPAPLLLSRIEDRDLWRFQFENTRRIQAAVFSYPYTFPVWDRLMATPLGTLDSEGEALERKHFKDINEFIEVAATRKVIAGYDVPVINIPYFFGSDACHLLCQGQPFAAYYWDKHDGSRVWGFRSDKEHGINVAEIAALFGGGGHPNASGCVIPPQGGLNINWLYMAKPADWVEFVAEEVSK